MKFSCILVLSCLATLGSLHGQGDPPDPFTILPFQRWLTEPDQARFRWSVHATAGDLSPHQRLRAKIEIQIDGNEMVNRRGTGQLLLLIQFNDSNGHPYQSHGALDLQDVKDEVAKSNIIYSQDAFIIPGDYRVAVGIVDTKTGEHSVLQRTLRVNPLKGDPFPNSWNDLPAVEFLANADPPEGWFQPRLKARLRLPVEAKRPVRIEILVNASPAPVREGVVETQLTNRSLNDLIPSLKVISNLDIGSGTMNISLLDLTRRREIFEQKNAHELDWAKLGLALKEADPNKIDVRSLERRAQNAQFFVEQVKRRIAGTDTARSDASACAVIVLSGPMGFTSGEDLHPINSEIRGDCKTFYIRYHAMMPRIPLSPIYEPTFGGRRNAPLPPRLQPAEPLDALAGMLKPLQPKLFDVYSPEQFRKALRQLLDEVSRM